MKVLITLSAGLMFLLLCAATTAAESPYDKAQPFKVLKVGWPGLPQRSPQQNSSEDEEDDGKKERQRVRWSDSFDREGAGWDWALSVAVKDNRLFTAGMTETASGGSVFSIRAYNANGGQLLWENHYDREEALGDGAGDVAVEDGRVFVAGWSQTSAGGYSFSVRAYDAIGGRLLWENHFDREGELEDWANKIVVKGNKVFAVGATETEAGGFALTVRAYDACTGRLLWQNYYDREGAGWDVAYAVTVEGDKVFVGGTTETTEGGFAFTVRVYDARNGSLLWQDNYDREGNLSDWVTSMVTSGDRLFVAGATETTEGGLAMTVRAYNARNGQLLWDDNYDREGTGWDGAFNVAVHGDNVFAVGATETEAGGSGYTVRAYRDRGHSHSPSVSLPSHKL
jgi:TolB-like protein